MTNTMVRKCHNLSGVYVYIVATVLSVEMQYTPLFHILCLHSVRNLSYEIKSGMNSHRETER